MAASPTSRATGLAFSDGAVEIKGEFGRPDWSRDGIDGGLPPRNGSQRPTRTGRSTRGTVRTRISIFSASTARRRSRRRATAWCSPSRNYDGRCPQRPARSSPTQMDRTGAPSYEGPVTDDLAAPAWSPRGDTILFGLGGFFQRRSIRTARLMTIGVDGTRPHRPDGRSWQRRHAELVAGRQAASSIASSTARRAAFAFSTSATRTTRVLDTGSNYDTFPTWSPRGDWIAFTSKRDGDYEIYRIRPDGTQLQRLTRLRRSGCTSEFLARRGVDCVRDGLPRVQG